MLGTWPGIWWYTPCRVFTRGEFLMVGALWNVDTGGCYGVSTSLVLPWDLLAADHWIRVVG